MLAFRPEAHTPSRRRPSRPARALVRARPADLLDEQRIDAAIGIEPRHAGQTAIDHHAHAIDGQRGFRDIRGYDHLSFLITRHRRVLVGDGKLSVQRQHEALGTRAGFTNRRNRAADFVGARHEDESIAVALPRDPFEFVRSRLPHGSVPDRTLEILHIHRIRAAARSEKIAGRQITLKRARIQRRGHDHDPQIGPPTFLQIQRARQRDVSVEMALVKLVEDDGAHAAEVRVAQHLTEQHAFRDETNPRPGGADLVQPDLVSDFVPEPHAPFLRHPRGEHSRGQPAWLEHDDLPVFREAVIKKNLRRLGGFSRAGGRLQTDARTGAKRWRSGIARVQRWEVRGDSRGGQD